MELKITQNTQRIKLYAYTNQKKWEFKQILFSF